MFPFIKFPGVDTILGPEMKSTGEVMGVGETFAEAFVKSQLAAGVRLPREGKVFVSVKDADKPRAIELATHPGRAGLHAGRDARHGGGARGRGRAGDARSTRSHEGRPHIVDMMKNDEIALVVNTVQEKRSAIQDSYQIRREALTDQIPTYTTLAGARAAALGLPGCASSSPTRCRRCTSGCTDERVFRSPTGREPPPVLRRRYEKVPMTIEGAARLQGRAAPI